MPESPEQQYLETLLGQQLRRIRSRFLLHGIGVLLFITGAVSVAYYGLDRLLQLPPAVRVLLSLALAGYLVFLTRRWLLYPLGRSFTRGDVAIAFEQRFPELRQKLISALQLGRRAGAGELRNESAAMVERLLQDARDHVRRVPHQQLLSPVETGKVWAAAVGVTVIVLLGAADNPAATGVFLWRVLGLDVAYPRATTLHLVLPEGKDYRIHRGPDPGTVHLTLAAGGDLPVVVRVEGEVPKQVYMMVRGGRGMARQNSMTRRGENRFRHVFRRVSGDFVFHAAGGDDPEGDLTVHVKTLQPPRVQTIQALVHYPAYTGMAPTTQVGGTVEALIGSRIQLDVSVTEDIQRASLTFHESGRQIDLVPTVINDDAGARTVYRQTLLHTQSDRYQVTLLGKAGLTNPHPGTYQLLAIPDHAPVGNVLAPENDNLNVVLPDGIIPVRIQARDDFGLTKGTLTLQSDKADAAMERAVFQHHRDRPDEPPTKECVLQDFVDLAQPPGERSAVAIGQTLLITAQLQDNRHPEPNSTKLTPRQIYVIGETDLLRRVAGHFRRVREAAEQNLRLQTDRHERLLDILETLGASVPNHQVAITAIEVAQARIQGAAGRIHAQLMQAFDFHLLNRLDSANAAKKVEALYRDFHTKSQRPQRFHPDFYQDVAARRRDGRLGDMEVLDPILQMTESAGHMADELAPKALKELAAARVAPSTKAAETALKTAAAHQTAIIKVLQELLSRLDRWHEFQDLIENTRSLRDSQRDIRSRTRSLGQPKDGQPQPEGEKRR